MGGETGTESRKGRRIKVSEHQVGLGGGGDRAERKSRCEITHIFPVPSPGELYPETASSTSAPQLPSYCISLLHTLGFYFEFESLCKFSLRMVSQMP